MEYQIIYDEAEDCSYVTITGKLTVNDYKTIFLDAWGRESYIRAKCAVWNFSECRTHFDLRGENLDTTVPSGEAKRRAIAKLAVAAAQHLAEFTHDHRPPVLPPRIAVIANNDLDFGMMRVYMGFTGIDEEDLRIFKSLERAREWLFG